MSEEKKPSQKDSPKQEESPQDLKSTPKDEMGKIPIAHGDKIEDAVGERSTIEELEDLKNMIRKAEKVSDPEMSDEEEMDDEGYKKRAADRLQKLRNLTFNRSDENSNKEFEEVPAYVRRNMELYSEKNVVRGFYSDIDKSSQGKSLYSDNNLTLFFDLEEYDQEEIIEIVGLLSDLYHSIGGDRLTIKTINTFELFPVENPVLV